MVGSGPSARLAPMARVLVTEKIADGGLDALRAAGHDVDVRTGLDPEQLVEADPGRPRPDHPLVHPGHGRGPRGRHRPGGRRSGRHRPRQRRRRRPPPAAASWSSTPRSRTSCPPPSTPWRCCCPSPGSVPQAHGALVDGRWERSKWVGVELADKTLGIVGLGRIGKLVAQRASAFGMKIIAHDPFVAAERARQLNIELVDLDTLAATADFVTLHVVKTPETIGMIGEDFFAKAKPGIRIVNVVARRGHRRGGAGRRPRRRALRRRRARRVRHRADHRVAAVRASPASSARPHLGASTREAQDKAGDTIAEQVRLALAGEFVPFAVNVAAAEASETVRPFLGVAEQLGGDLRRPVRRPAAGRSRSSTRASWPASTPASSPCRRSRAPSPAPPRSRSATSTPRRSRPSGASRSATPRRSPHATGST